MYHPSCPHCRSPRVVKHGGNRWLCQCCRRTFRIKKPDRRDRGAIDGYLFDRSTYERLGKRWRVHRSAAYRRVRRALAKRLTLLERTKRLLSHCDGVCLLDGKQMRVRGKLHTCFVAWDRGLGKPIHFLLKEGGEGELWYWRLIVDLERLGYRPKGFVSDGLLVLKEFLAERYPDLPHQRCTVHVFLAARGKVAAGRKTTKRTSAFIDLLKAILWARTLASAERRLFKVWNLRGLTAKERRVLEFVWSALPECFVCRSPKGRRIALPRSSNAIENVMGQIEARLKTRRGTKSSAALEALVNAILLSVSEQTITHR